MTHADDIDERRATLIADWLFAVIWEGSKETPSDFSKRLRAEDEAAGYILIKHEGVISAEGMKPKGGE